MADDPGRVLAFPRAPDAIELRHLRSFVAVAEELNFGRAAEQLYLSQPALSRHIRALEQLLGCELLRRSTHRVELTLAGESLLDRARKVLSDVDEAVSITQSVGNELESRGARMWQNIADLTARAPASTRCARPTRRCTPSSHRRPRSRSGQSRRAASARSSSPRRTQPRCR